MGLNKSKGNMYPWVTHTFNTVKGACFHDCSYCYMKRWGALNPPRLDKGEFRTDLGFNHTLFMGSSIDLFAQDIPDAWILRTLDYLRQFDYNTYLFQSKNPARMIAFENLMPVSSILCTTLETNRWYPDIMRKSPAPEERSLSLSKSQNKRRFITIEPIIDFDLPEFIELIRRCEPEQVNIGADSGNNNLPEPEVDKLLYLIEELKSFTTITRKSNLDRILKLK